jgi:hypothetical protein
MSDYERVKEEAEGLVGEIEANLADPSCSFLAESIEGICESLQNCADKCRAFGTDEMNNLATLLEDNLSEVRTRGSDLLGKEGSGKAEP